MARPHAASAWRTAAAEHSVIVQLLVSGRSGTNPGLALAGCKAKSMRGSRRLRGDVEHGFGERFGRFLRQVVADAVGDEPMRVFAGELSGVRRRVRMRRAVGVAFQR